MTRKNTTASQGKVDDRKARLAAALKANMARRKAQARARTSQKTSEAETQAGKDNEHG